MEIKKKEKAKKKKKKKKTTKKKTLSISHMNSFYIVFASFSKIPRESNNNRLYGVQLES